MRMGSSGHSHTAVLHWAGTLFSVRPQEQAGSCYLKGVHLAAASDNFCVQTPGPTYPGNSLTWVGIAKTCSFIRLANSVGSKADPGSMCAAWPQGPTTIGAAMWVT